MVFLAWFLSSEDLHNIFVLLFKLKCITGPTRLHVYCLSLEPGCGDSKLCGRAYNLVLRGREG
jgi:hypothetical protein